MVRAAGWWQDHGLHADAVLAVARAPTAAELCRAAEARAASLAWRRACLRRAGLAALDDLR